MLCTELFEYLTPAQERLLRRHQQRLNRQTWRAKQRKRFGYEQEAMEQEFTRHIPKSYINYKPFKIPLIRFGKFGKHSRIYLDTEFRDEAMGSATHESGVSCFQGYPQQDGYEVLNPSPSGAAYHSGDYITPVINQFKTQLIAYLDHGTPMDIFLIHGHLVSFW